MPSDISQLEPVLRLALALALGGVIGIERRWRGHVAGPHANALVAMGAALFMLLSGNVGPEGPAREAAQIAAGIGFLAGGVILRDRFKIQGLNTAATIWCVAATGCIAGIGSYTLAIAATALTIIGNSIFHVLEHRVLPLPGGGDQDQQDRRRAREL
ncbi:MAG: MgtC/SapB family protein [Proteobacteria bacterium]|nr:MgtC/SapB family protein [Pseudomonadota bacterium]